MSARWERPASVPYPKIWRRYQGKRPMADGTVPRFRIQDVTEDIADQVIDHMSTIYLRDEIISASIDMLSDDASIQELRKIWRELLNQRLSLVALVDNFDDDKPRIAGVNILGVGFKNDEKGFYKKMHGEKSREFVRAMEKVQSHVDVFKKYNVHEYMKTLGLSVDPEFRGQDLGVELLKTRVDVGRQFGLKLTVTVFSSVGGRKQAERAGFELLYEQPYCEYLTDDGKIAFPIGEGRSMALMAMRLD